MPRGADVISTNEKSFIVEALKADQRIDGRRPFDIRRLKISFGKADGTVEIQLGQTRVLAVVSAELSAPYPDRANEGSLSVFTEFSPMADPGFEAGRPGEAAIELGRVVDRGLRESRAIDTEALCIVAGRAVWAVRLDIHILDNGGNLIDAANLAALAALLAFRRPDCSTGGADGTEVIVHPPEEQDPIPLAIHHLPIAITFAFFEDGELVLVDPSLKEEASMGGRLTITVNSHSEICAVQKGGGIGVSPSQIMRCARIAAAKAAELTKQIKQAVEAQETSRAAAKVKRQSQPSAPADLVLTELDLDGGVKRKAEESPRGEEPKEEQEAEPEEESESSEEESDEGETKGPFTGGASAWEDKKEESPLEVVPKGASWRQARPAVAKLEKEAIDEFDKVAAILTSGGVTNAKVTVTKRKTTKVESRKHVVEELSKAAIVNEADGNLTLASAVKLKVKKKKKPS